MNANKIIKRHEVKSHFQEEVLFDRMPLNTANIKALRVYPASLPLALCSTMQKSP